ncbi:uncharacterized protein LOC134224739 [Armigeres subalbatus]|uniref:uncharacterized protein LOC134224739 n=1 Tax=Armigeres subalbatus TaxID=124917 RepID=UPI002ED6B399
MEPVIEKQQIAQPELEIEMEFEEGKVQQTLYPESHSDIVNQTVGPEYGAIRCLFRVAKREFVGQRIILEELNHWLIGAHCIETFRVNLWQLAEPHIRQAVVVKTDKNGTVVDVHWGDSTRPTMEEGDRFITFIDKRNRRFYPWRHLNVAAIERWKNSTSIVVCIYMYSTAISSRPIFEFVSDHLLNPKALRPKPKVRPVIPPAADGYSFRDEVRAIRETFLQMRDLMHILENRISLLEAKCDQSFQREPMIMMPDRFDQQATDQKSHNSDPLQYDKIKEEDEEED